VVTIVPGTQTRTPSRKRGDRMVAELAGQGVAVRLRPDGSTIELSPAAKVTAHVLVLVGGALHDLVLALASRTRSIRPRRRVGAALERLEVHPEGSSLSLRVVRGRATIHDLIDFSGALGALASHGLVSSGLGPGAMVEEGPDRAWRVAWPTPGGSWRATVLSSNDEWQLDVDDFPIALTWRARPSGKDA
jgi:hypothetical protein